MAPLRRFDGAVSEQDDELQITLELFETQQMNSGGGKTLLLRGRSVYDGVMLINRPPAGGEGLRLVSWMSADYVLFFIVYFRRAALLN